MRSNIILTKNSTELFDLNKENELLLSNICHEIGNPLTLIYGNMQLLQDEHPEIMDFERWQLLFEDVTETIKLFHDLTDYNGSTQIHTSITDLYELVYEVTDSFQTTALKRKIKIEIIENEINQVVTDYICDRLKMKQAVTNLLKNSIEAALDDSTVYVSISTDGLSVIQLSIRNQGTPIPIEDVDSLFVPFKTSKQNGHGLGLPISNRIVQAHGGKIKVHSENNETTFTIELPVTH